jgi:hypothetical protein
MKDIIVKPKGQQRALVLAGVLDGTCPALFAISAGAEGVLH